MVTITTVGSRAPFRLIGEAPDRKNERQPRPTDWLRSFEIALVDERVAAISRRAYVSDVERFLRWAGVRGTTDPLAVTVADVFTYRDGLLLEQGQAIATVRRNLSSLRRFYGWLSREGFLPRSPLGVVRNPRRAAARPPVFRPWKDVTVLIETARATGLDRDRVRNELIVTVLAHTGLRLAELVALRWGDVHLDLATLEVKAGKEPPGRKVPINGVAHKALLAAWHASRVPDGGMFVLTGATTPLSSRAVQYVLKSLARRAGLTGPVSPHVLRHSFATTYLMLNPGDLMGLAGILGHSSVATTASYASAGALDAAQRMEALTADPG